MNSLSRKIIVALFAVMLSINLISPDADAVDHCVGSSCLHCNGMMLSHSESLPVFGSDGPMCHSSFANSPCNLNRNPESNTKIFIVSSIKQDRHETGGSFTISNREIYFLPSIRENRAPDQFRPTTGNIPIYLQNLSFLC
jgi:hypothetical protein